MICDENEENNLSQQIVESGVKSRKISIFKEFLRHDKNTFHLPRQDKRVDCISPQRGAVSGQITAYKKVRYYGIATNEVLEPKI